MKNIKKLLFIGAFLGILIIPNISSAATVADLQAQIQALLAQIQQLQAQLAQMQGQPVVWCHDFSVNLSIGSSGSEVESLRTVLEKEGFKIETRNFNESMASSVTGFQQKYKDEILSPLGLQYGTGYVGKATRAKLNSLYGCGVIATNQPPVISGVSGPTTLKINETGKWEIKASDPERGVLTYQVLWGDEAFNPPGSILPLSFQTATCTHSYSKAGIYNPTFTVTDNNGLSAKITISVNVGAVVVQPSITVLSPNGGETWAKGTTQTIKWNSNNVSYISVILNRGLNTVRILADTIPNQGFYQWTIPSDLLDGNDYIIRITQSGLPISLYDTSDAPFSIVAAGVEQTSQLNQMASALESAKAILNQLLQALKNL